MEKHSKKELNSKKWSFGKFFRKKKNIESESSDESHKAGFLSQNQPKEDKRNRTSKITGSTLDYYIKSPIEKKLFQPLKEIQLPPTAVRSTGYLDRRVRRERRRTTQLAQHHSSSEDEPKSHNTLSLPKYRSDDSLGSSSGIGGNRKSRSARNDRYYKRMSRDDLSPQVQAIQQVGKSKLEPNTITSNSNRQAAYNLKNSLSLNHVPSNRVCNFLLQNKPKTSSPVSANKRSVSYDNDIYLQNKIFAVQVKNSPPPPPPRDPQRRLQIQGQSQKEIRPMSYSFDKNVSSVYPVKGRCISDDKLWGLNEYSNQSIPAQRFSLPHQAASHPRRFITRSERDQRHKTLPGSIDYQYVADIEPRFRKPSVIQGALNSWKNTDQNKITHRENNISKPRLMSSSPAGDLKRHRNTMFENLYQIENPKTSQNTDEIDDSIVSGSLFIKPTEDVKQRFIEISNRPYKNKSSSMPNYYKQYQAKCDINRPLTTLPFKFNEYIISQNDQNPTKREIERAPPIPPQRKKHQLYSEDEMGKSKNLEDAINELESIYKSFKLDDEELDKAKIQDKPISKKCQENPVTNRDENIKDSKNQCEPDIVLDDVFYRNLKPSKSVLKTFEPQPPFGISIFPVPSSSIDYLNVAPQCNKKNCNTPDLVTDDMAVRSLRKVPLNTVKPNLQYPTESSKKKRVSRSQSANIYNLIHRDAMKPSGGNLYDYYHLEPASEKAGSCTDIHKKCEDNDVLSRLHLLLNMKNEDEKLDRRNSTVFSHPKEVGGVFSLPSTLKLENQSDSMAFVVDNPHVTNVQCKSPIPINNNGMEDILNKIAKEAKDSSEKLSRDLIKLRKEINTSSRSDRDDLCNKTILKLDNDIGEKTVAADVCEKISQDVLVEPEVVVPISKLQTQAKLELESNNAGEKILNHSLQDQSNVPNEDSIEKMQSSNKLTNDNREEQQNFFVASLIENLDPSSAKIGDIAARCMRQISELGDLKDEVVPIEGTVGSEKPDYNLNTNIVIKNVENELHHNEITENKSLVPGKAPLASHDEDDDDEDDIEDIMRQCEKQTIRDAKISDPIISNDSRQSSSDCNKSSSPTPSKHQSSSITSIHAFSSSDYIKSPSSEFNTQSSDPIKTFSTTSYEVASSSITPNITTSPYSTTSSPLLDLTPVSYDVDSTLQYNSSEELAMIFGNNQSTCSPVTTTESTATTGSVAPDSLLKDLEKKLSSTTAKITCQPQHTNRHLEEQKNSEQLKIQNNFKSVSSILNDSKFCNNYKNNSDIKRESNEKYQSSSILGEKQPVIFSCVNFKPAKPLFNARSEPRPISALYDIICKEKEIETNEMNTCDDAGQPKDVKASNICEQQTNNNSSSSGMQHTISSVMTKPVRATKSSRLRAAALDKNSKDRNENSLTCTRHSSKSNSSDTNKSSEDTLASRHINVGVLTSRKPLLVSSTSSTISPGSRTPTSDKNLASLSNRLKRITLNGTSSPRENYSKMTEGKNYDNNIQDVGPSKLAIVPNPIDTNFIRARTSTMNSNTIAVANCDIEYSSVPTKETLDKVERDKSSKRKSNLNRSLTEESTEDDDAALRRRRRRQLGLARKLVPTDEISEAIKNVISPLKIMQPRETYFQSPVSPVRNDLSYHMANARKELRSHSSPDRRRANTVSPNLDAFKLGLVQKTPEKSKSVPLTRSIYKEYDNLPRHIHISDLTQKVNAFRERTKSELLGNNKITAKCSEKGAWSHNICDQGTIYNMNNNEENISQSENSKLDFPLSKYIPIDFGHIQEHDSSSNKFKKEDRISFDDENEEKFSVPPQLEDIKQLSPRKFLKAGSHDKEPSTDPLFITSKLSPILRRKSSEEQNCGTSNPIVSILKKKDHPEPSSASCNVSPVTFSSSVVDTPIRSSKRQGILKKRSSLDESRYTRSQSPDDKSILVKTVRRNSLEEIQHGILKQRSYEIKSDGYSSAEPHGILKKKDASSTPSDNNSKHVSISEAVILAAAELCKNVFTTENEFDIKPILKTDIQEIRTPKPILKKKYSSEIEEIRPILKTSRKSSREETSDNDDCFKPILKSDSPARRRSFVDRLERNKILQRSRSLEIPETQTSVPSPEVSPTEKPVISVAERIRNIEKCMMISENVRTSASSSGAIPKLPKSNLKMNICRNRFKTQPVTVKEINCLRNLDLYKPSSLESLNTISPKNLSYTQNTDTFSPQSLSHLNCSSINSHSGLWTGTRSPEMSAFVDLSTSDAKYKIENKADLNTDLLEPKEIYNTDFKETNTSDLRKHSLQVRADMFQQLEEKLKESNADKPTTPRQAKALEYDTSQSISMGEMNISKDSLHSTNELNFESTGDEVNTPKELHSTHQSNLESSSGVETMASSLDLKLPTQSDEEFKSLILKSKSGCIGFAPIELKNKLNKTADDNILNFEKIQTPENTFKSDSKNNIGTYAGTSSESDEDGVEPEKNLAKILRTVSKENMHKQQTSTKYPTEHYDTLYLVRNLVSLEQAARPEIHSKNSERCRTTSSEGESSGGKEISLIIKNNAVPNRTKLNEE